MSFHAEHLAARFHDSLGSRIGAEDVHRHICVDGRDIDDRSSILAGSEMTDGSLSAVHDAPRYSRR